MNTWIPIDDALADIQKLVKAGLSHYGSIPGASADSVLYTSLPAAVYHADRDALSCSMLKPLLVSPAHFQGALMSHSPASPAKDYGSLVHLLLLEPERLSSEVAVYPGVGSGRDREYRSFLTQNSHRLAVDEPTFRSARELTEKIATTRYRGRPLARFVEESMRECSIYFIEPATGLRLRVRFDALHPEISFDLKTTRRATPAAFARDAVEMSYDLQAFLYGLARGHYDGDTVQKPFVFVTAETSYPHSVCTHVAGSSFLENGATKLQECLATFKACTQVGHWPDLSCHSTLEITPWQQFERQTAWRSEPAG